MKEGCNKKIIEEIFCSLMDVTNNLLQKEYQPLKLPQSLPKSVLGLVVYVGKL
jgi:hypothetical protein